MHGRYLIAAALLVIPVILFGCRGESPTTPEHSASGPNAALASAFDEESCGTISGRVCWHGEAPGVPPFRHWDWTAQRTSTWPNPNAPAIDPTTGGVGGAVVFLRDVDITRARPWDHGPVRAVVLDNQIAVLSGTKPTPCGLVRRGESIGLVNWDATPQQMRVRGASFFTLPLVERDVATRRAMTEQGAVELSGGTGDFWMRGHLFVDEHPYYVVTDSQGRFTLSKVPAGTYRVVCWLPNWHVARRQRDQESTAVIGVEFAPAMEKGQTLDVQAGKAATMDFSVGKADFPVP